MARRLKISKISFIISC